MRFPELSLPRLFALLGSLAPRRTDTPEVVDAESGMTAKEATLGLEAVLAVRALDELQALIAEDAERDLLRIRPSTELADEILRLRLKVADLEHSLEEHYDSRHMISWCCDCGYEFLPHGQGGKTHDCPTPGTMAALWRDQPDTARHWRYVMYRRHEREHAEEATRLLVTLLDAGDLRVRLEPWLTEHKRLAAELSIIEADR